MPGDTSHVTFGSAGYKANTTGLLSFSIVHLIFLLTNHSPPSQQHILQTRRDAFVLATVRYSRNVNVKVCQTYEVEILTDSRRREAAELARALALSTQEAAIITSISTGTDSPTTTTTASSARDSREMELRPVYDMGTVNPAAVMRPPTSSIADPISSSRGSGSSAINGEPAQGTQLDREC